MNVRVGHGFDVHPFGPGDDVVLGGVRIAFARGLRAHSDGDVVLHALCDALLGAAGLGDIGVHFPSEDPLWAGADSRSMVRHVRQQLLAAGLRPFNADVTVVCQEPRLQPHREAMREHIAADLLLPLGAVNVKATTTDGLGCIGRGEGIAAHAVVTVYPDPDYS